METRARDTYVEVMLSTAVPVDDEEPRDSSAIPAGLPLARVRSYSDADMGDTFGIRIARQEVGALLGELVSVMTPAELERLQRVVAAAV